VKPYNVIKLLFALCLFALTSGGASGALAAPPGPEVCQGCHEEKVAQYSHSIHGAKSNLRGPANAGQCSTCHGDGTEHVAAGGGRGVGGIRNPGSKLMSAAESSETCLACHGRDANRMHWKGSIHPSRDIACASCHSMHGPVDKVLDKRLQPEVCYQCHKDKKASANKPSHHPIVEGKMACSSCHNPHGTVGKALLKMDTTNDTCFLCHAEKRGPFLWSHQPVVEDCGLCHDPHGTTADTMLKIRPPFLCLECHDPSSHLGNIPGVSRNTNQSKNASGTSLGATTPADNFNTNTAVGKTQGLACLNCHTNIHGGNNPANSGTAPTMFR
jgi:DmsE family decaheme c-type cytochrome